jgi:hypothetical protein
MLRAVGTLVRRTYRRGYDWDLRLGVVMTHNRCCFTETRSTRFVQRSEAHGLSRTGDPAQAGRFTFFKNEKEPKSTHSQRLGS